MPYFRVDFEKWIPTHQKDEIIPYHPLYLSTPVQKEDEITGSCSIKVTNIGMGMAKNPNLHTGHKTQGFTANWSLYLSDFGFSKTKLMIFSTFSKWSDGELMTNEYRFK